MKTKRVSDIITTKEIKTWKENDVITISAGTGAGKSYFIKNVLYDYVKEDGDKILFLVHRSNCKNQFVNELKEKNDVFDVKTYQSLEYACKNNKEINLSEYKYIVCDEYQYFNNDCAFNKWTDVSFKTIINTTNNIKIFMSATAISMKNLMKNYYKLNIKDYKIKTNYSHIDEIKYYNVDSTMYSIIDKSLEKNQKIIVFIDSAKKCYETYLLYKDCATFNCSKNNKEYYKYVDTEEIEEILVTEKLTKNILFTTCCLDAGVNITDTSIKNIVLDVKSVNQLVQCAGRRRKQNNKDKFTLYIKNRNKFELANMMKSLNVKGEKALYLLFNGQESFVNKYNRSTNTDMVYDVIDENGNIQKEVNILMVNNNIDNKVEINEMQDIGYVKYINKIFGKRKGEIMEETEEEETISKYVKNILGKRLFKEDREELIRVIGLKDSRGRIQKSLGTISQYLVDNCNVFVISKKVKIDGKKTTVWILNQVK